MQMEEEVKFKDEAEIDDDSSLYHSPPKESQNRFNVAPVLNEQNQSQETDAGRPTFL